MSFDAFTVSALVDELRPAIGEGRVQDVIDVEQTAIGLEVYANRQRRYLYLGADKQAPRVLLAGDKLRRGIQKPTQLGLLFRRFIEGARITSIDQPPFERILEFTVEHPAEGSFRIVVEIMPRRSNLILVRDGVVLDCIWRVGPEDNRYRVTLPNHPYEPPPPLTGRLQPEDVTPDTIAELLGEEDNAGEQAMRVLSRRILGITPHMGREIVFRAAGETNAKAEAVDPDEIYRAFDAVMMPLLQRDWKPGIATQDGRPLAFAVYPLTHRGDWQPTDTLSGAIAAVYGAPIGEEAYAQAKKPVQEAIKEAKIRVSARIESMESGVKDESERERLQQSGELILAYQYNLTPGQTELVAQYDPEGPELHIKLDPDKTPLENAQAYFDRYNRAKRAQKNVPRMIAKERHELRYIEQLEMDLESASNWPEIDDVIQALQERGYMGRERKLQSIGGSGRSGPMRLTHDGYVLWVGRNSRQNEQVTIKNANPQDIWLHARDVPGAHVVIRNDGRRIPRDLIENAAAIAAYYSKRRNDGSVPVDVTRVKYVRKIKGAGPGMVTYRNEETLFVTPQDESILTP